MKKSFQHRRLAALCAILLAGSVTANEARDVAIGRAVERHLSPDDVFALWAQDPDLLDEQAGDTIETREVAVDAYETVKLTDVVPPIRFESGVAEIPEATISELRSILDGMRHRHNVRLHLVGHADNQPLSAELARRYTDNMGLSRERAGEVAELFQRALYLPPDSISYEWAGDSRPVADNATPQGRALNRRVEVEVWYDEPTDSVAREEVIVAHDLQRIKVCRVETVCKLRYLEGHGRRARVQNLIAPLHYGEDAIDVSSAFVGQVEQALRNLRDKDNVVVKFVGHTDSTPLGGRTDRIYGSHDGLSKARARRVALAVQEALNLPTAAVDSDGRGSERPLASNETPQGRALNRRVEVEFWYDDPLQDLPDEPQICPDAGGAETVTRVYDPPWGTLTPLRLEQGNPVIPPGFLDNVRRALADVEDRTRPRVRFIGYTANERLDRRTAAVYGDDIGLSAARARRTQQAVGDALGLAAAEMEYEGRGYLHSDDVVNAGFVQGDTSHVVVQVVYDELAVLDDYEGVDIARMTREFSPRNPFALNLMRITVDGRPIDDPGKSSADVQRCTDVAMERAQIQFGFDNLSADRRLSVAARPNRIAVLRGGEGGAVAAPVRFRMYANYQHFIEKAEVRIFKADQSLQSMPLGVAEIGPDGTAEWLPPAHSFAAPMDELRYVLRAYGRAGGFDETRPATLWLVYDERPAMADDVEEVEDVEDEARDPEQDAGLLAAYGESALMQQNIPLGSGTVKVQGSGIPAGHSVWVAGRPVPVDSDGRFAAEEILPTGTHTVEVAVLDPQGNGELFLRDLEFPANDWFYVGMADLTLSHGKTNGPMSALQGANAIQDYDSSADGRLAFYVNGKFRDHWRVTASADTREAPLGDLFSNFTRKTPDSLFRRIDPDHHYPTFGDDGTVEETAPTQGKFYARLARGENYGLWGNFKVGYMNNELAQVDRGLYGGNVHYQSTAETRFGEQRLSVDAFAAEPGTIPGREEFRGTGGSLYFLRRQDILTGSDRVRVEIRDKASGIVTGVVSLRPGLDYDIDYLQGTLLLAEPLTSTVDDDLLVRSGALHGDEAYLVVRYEYTPGFNELDALAVGTQVHYWLNDYVGVGLTANANEQDEADSALHAGDVTLRMSTQSWLKLQAARSEGLISSTARSDDGGFGFYGYDDMAFADANARAYRADLSVGFEDVVDGARGRLTVYLQSLDAGYSAPGLATLTDAKHYGGAFDMPFGERLAVRAKSDARVHDEGIRTDAQELNVRYQLTDHWDVSAGVRRDLREDRSPIVPLTQNEGERTDGVIRVGYDSKHRWRSYAFVQDTLTVSGDREENGRVGLGGSFRVTDRLRLDAEVSDGDLGYGGRVGTNYIHSERTTLYLNYTLENERTDNGLRSHRGSDGNLVAGVKSRLTDSTSVYLEERYRHNDSVTGLTHAAGLNLAPTQRLNMGAKTEFGTLVDVQSGAETERNAIGVQVGYGFDAMQVSSGIEYRADKTEQPELSIHKRTTWLFRNNLKYQMTPSSRLLGKLNHAESESSLGQFYDGGYTEAVLGYAFRPVRHDRLNMLAKYTYFYNVPSTDQVTVQNTAVEFIQKSHIAALDVMYDLTPRWSLGGKYAYRLGQVSLDREDREFFDNTAQLYVLRADWRFRQHWEMLLETRVLDMPDLGDRRSGALVSVSRQLGNHFKVGVGFNFTDFSDDLTDLSFDHRGAFLNVTGAM
jgi:flagellar motor protein MotB